MNQPPPHANQMHAGPGPAAYPQAPESEGATYLTTPGVAPVTVANVNAMVFDQSKVNDPQHLMHAIFSNEALTVQQV